MTDLAERAPVARLLYTIDEAAEAAGISRRQIERCIADGRLNVVRKFGRPLIPVGEIIGSDQPPLRTRRPKRSPIAP